MILTVGGFYLRGARWMIVLALLSSIGIAGVAAIDLSSALDHTSEINAGGLFTASVGSGLYLILIACVPLLACTGYLSLRRM